MRDYALSPYTTQLYFLEIFSCAFEAVLFILHEQCLVLPSAQEPVLDAGATEYDSGVTSNSLPCIPAGSI